MCATQKANASLVASRRDRLLCVAYTLRGERVHSLSARLAEPQEKRRYHEENGQTNAAIDWGVADAINNEQRRAAAMAIPMRSR